MICGDQSLVKASEGAITVKPLYCGRWSCDTCAPRLKDKVQILIARGKPDAMMTFTLRHGANDDPVALADKLVASIKEYFRRLRRKTGRKVEYFVVPEPHKDGAPHAHLAVRGWKYVHINRLKRLWELVTGGSYQVDVRRIPSTRIKNYIAKYMSKDPGSFGRHKHYYKTRGWLLIEGEEVSDEQMEEWRGWKRDERHRREIIDEHRRKGWYAVEAWGDATVLLPPPWRGRTERGPPRLQDLLDLEPPQRAALRRIRAHFAQIPT